MKKQQELKILEEIENAPLPPDIIPVVMIMDESQEIEVPSEILDFFTEMNDTSKINKNGMMYYDDYKYLLNKYNLGRNRITGIIFN